MKTLGFVLGAILMVGCHSIPSPVQICKHSADLMVLETTGKVSVNRADFGTDQDYRRFQDHLQESIETCNKNLPKSIEIAKAEGRSAEIAERGRCFLKAGTVEEAQPCGLQ